MSAHSSTTADLKSHFTTYLFPQATNPIMFLMHSLRMWRNTTLVGLRVSTATPSVENARVFIPARIGFKGLLANHMYIFSRNASELQLLIMYTDYIYIYTELFS